MLEDGFFARENVRDPLALGFEFPDASDDRTRRIDDLAAEQRLEIDFPLNANGNFKIQDRGLAQPLCVAAPRNSERYTWAYESV